jgi:hypothetical protein
MPTAAEFRDSIRDGRPMPDGLGPELRALWLCRAGRWDEAHSVAQDIHTPEGSWIHALLHLIEGDESNARYWYARAGRPAAGAGETDAEWDRIATAILERQDPRTQAPRGPRPT